MTNGNEAAIPAGDNLGVFNYFRSTIVATLRCKDCGKVHKQRHHLHKLWSINLDEIIDENCPHCGLGSCELIESEEL